MTEAKPLSKEEIAELRNLVGNSNGVIRRLIATIEAREAEIERLREALETYGVWAAQVSERADVPLGIRSAAKQLILKRINEALAATGGERNV